MSNMKYTLMNGALVRTRAGLPVDRRSEPAGVAHLIALRPSIADLEDFLERRDAEASLRREEDDAAGFAADDYGVIHHMDERLVIERAIEILKETTMTIPDLDQ